MAKEEKVKENGGRGLPLSLQSLQGGSTVDTGDTICLKIMILTKNIFSVIKKSSSPCKKEGIEGHSFQS